MLARLGWSLVERRVPALADADASFWGGSSDDQTVIPLHWVTSMQMGWMTLVIGVPGEDILSDEGAVYIGYSGY